MIRTTTIWDASPLKTVLLPSAVGSVLRCIKPRTQLDHVKCQKMNNPPELSLLATSTPISASLNPLVVSVDQGLISMLKEKIMSRFQNTIPTALKNVGQHVTVMN